MSLDKGRLFAWMRCWKWFFADMFNPPSEEPEGNAVDLDELISEASEEALHDYSLFNFPASGRQHSEYQRMLEKWRLMESTERANAPCGADRLAELDTGFDTLELLQGNNIIPLEQEEPPET